MNFSQTITHVMGLPFSWNDIFNWLFIITSTFALLIAIILQIVELIKNRGKTVNLANKPSVDYQGSQLTEKSKKTNK